METKDKRFDFFERDRFARHTGIELLEISEDMARAKLTVREHHLNGVDIVHGGALFTLADLVFGALGYVHDSNAVSINANINYFKAVRKGTLTAEGSLVTLTPKHCCYTVRVIDSEGDLVATFQGLGYRRRQSGDRSGG